MLSTHNENACAMCKNAHKIMHTYERKQISLDYAKIHRENFATERYCEMRKMLLKTMHRNAHNMLTCDNTSYKITSIWLASASFVLGLQRLATQPALRSIARCCA